MVDVESFVQRMKDIKKSVKNTVYIRIAEDVYNEMKTKDMNDLKAKINNVVGSNVIVTVQPIKYTTQQQIDLLKLQMRPLIEKAQDITVLKAKLDALQAIRDAELLQKKQEAEQRQKAIETALENAKASNAVLRTQFEIYQTHQRNEVMQRKIKMREDAFIKGAH